MNLKLKIAAIGGTALVAVGGGVGGALAATGSAPATSSKAFRAANAPGVGLGRGDQGRHRGLRGLRLILKAAADYLKLTPHDLIQQLRQGKSLAEIAQAQGKTADGLESAILDAVKARLDKAVGNGRLTADKEQQLLDKLKTRLDTLVNRHFGQPQTP